MKPVKAVFPIFFILLILSLLILFFFQTPLTAGLQFITLPIQRWVFLTSAPSSGALTPQQQLQQENNQLRTQLAQMQEMQKDNRALHDQFQTTTPSPQHLLPANIIGLQQNALMIDKGTQDTIQQGDVVVVKNNVIGTVTKTTAHISQVTLLSDPTTSFTAQTVKTSAIGIVKALDGGTIILDNVVLSDKLNKNDLVITKGEQDIHGHGYPPKLIVGKIVSVDKQASSLYQAAKLQSLVDISHLQMVFVMTE